MTERLRERRTTAREQLARHAELQRTTLLELQVMLLTCGWESWEAWISNSASGSMSRGPGSMCRRPPGVLRSPADGCSWWHLVLEDERIRELRENQRVAIARIGELLRERY